MKMKTTIIILSSLCVILIAAGLLIGNIILNKKRDKYPGSTKIIAFHDQNKELFLDIATALSQLSGYIDEDGYICYYNENRELVREYLSSVSELTRNYYKLASQQCKSYSISMGESGVLFEFHYEQKAKVAGIEYTKIPPDNENITFIEIGEGWYFFEYPYLT
jgi:hypothetical protein